MKHQFGLLLFLLLLSAPSYSQELSFPAKARFITAGVGIPFNNVRDQAHSVLAYKGRGTRFFFRTEDYGTNSLFRFQFTIDNIDLSPKLRPKQDIKRGAVLSDMHVSWGFYKRLGNDLAANDQQYLGLTYSIQVNTRKYQLPTNNIMGFLLHNGLSVSAIDRRLIDNSDWSVISRVDIPFFNGIYRPSYIGLAQVLHLQKPKFKDTLRGMEWGTFNIFTKISAGVDFDHLRQPWRSNRYSYDWQLFYTPRPATKPLISTTSAFQYGFNVLL